jgi:hypothetical protein
MSSYFFYQQTGGEDAWVVALSEHREKIQAEKSPAFVTVLDVHSVPDATWDRDQYASMKYSGGFFADWDAEKLEDAIPEFHKFIANLGDHGVNLKSLRLYATGGRGFHLEIPPQVFMAKVPKTGVTALPYVYREMAMEMVVDTLDLRVYTGRRGRMWRTCGVKRSNGAYKVPLTLAEALEITPESYLALCSEPRQEPERELPELSTYLSAMFIKFQEKTDTALKRRAKASGDVELLAKFNGEFPPTIEKIMRGEGLMPGVGFQKLSMQLAIAANALGKSADQLVEASQGLCKNHSGDSSRYGSPRKRKEELRRMWEYTHDNPCYEYSKGGIRSLVAPGEITADLDGPGKGLTSGASMENEAEDAPDVELTKDETEELDFANRALEEGLKIQKLGVFRPTPDGAKSVSNIGWTKPQNLLECIADGGGNHTNLGLVVNIFSDGKSRGRHTVGDKAFVSRSTLTQYCSAYGGIFSGSDTMAGAVKLILTRRANKEDRMIYAVHKEGLDIVQDPRIADAIKKDVIWVTPSQIFKDCETDYVYQPQMVTTPIFDSDLHMAEPLRDTPETREWMHAVLTINSPTTIAQMLGWFVSCFHKQFYQQAFSQFPLLHPNGPAGSGKTLTSQLLGRMHTFTREPKLQSCGTVTTQYALKASMTGSCSIPLILDEYKPAEMGPVRTDFLMQAFRLAYNQGKGASGAVGNSSAASSFKDITEFSFSTPLVYLAEAQEMQTAIVQRSLPVAFNIADTVGRKAAWDTALKGQDYMGQLGRSILKYAFVETVDTRRAALTPIRDELRASFPRGVHDRQVFNLAIVLEGLNYLDGILVSIFGSEFKEPMAVLKKAIHEHKAEINTAAQSEAGKMFNDMSLISRTITDSESELYMQEGRDYIVRDGYMEIRMREMFVKYYTWCKRTGMEPYYSSSEAFIVSMGKFPPTMDKVCTDSPLKATGQSRVFRFNLEKLMAEGVEAFRTK